MLTVDNLTEAIKPPLHHLEAPASLAPRLVEQVVVCGDSWTPSAGNGDGQIRGALVIAPATASWLDTPGETERCLRILEHQGAVGLVVAGHSRDVPLPARTAGRRGNLPLMVPALPSSATDLQTLLQRHQIEALRRHTRQQAHLLEMAPRLNLTSEGPQRLLRWLERQAGARVLVISGRTDRSWQAMAEAGHDGLLTDLRSGRVSTGTLDIGSQHYVLHTIGDAAPYRILVARRPTPWPYPARSLVPKVAGQLTLVSCRLELQAREQRLAHTEAANRATVFQALMNGALEQAERAVAPLLPELLCAPAAQICVLECPPGGDRRAIAAECEQALGWAALTVLHPADDRHIVICHPRTDGSCTAPELLAPVVNAASRLALGVSAPLPWTRTAQGYFGALKALETARTAPERTAVHNSGEPLAAVLANKARPWATTLLRPVRDAVESEAEGRCVVDTARLAATFGPMRAARVLGEMEVEGRPGPHRNTVTKRFLFAAQHAGLGSGLQDRAVLDLAIQVLDAHPAVAAVPQQAAPLHALLRSDPSVAEWAAKLLEPLSPEQEELLAVWLSEGTSTQHTADRYGVHRNTVRARLEAAGAVLSRPLLDPGSGPHDVLFALVAKGKLPLSWIPDPVAPGDGGPAEILAAA